MKKKLRRIQAGVIACLVLNLAAAAMPLLGGGPGWCCSITGACLGLTGTLAVLTLARAHRIKKLIREMEAKG